MSAASGGGGGLKSGGGGGADALAGTDVSVANLTATTSVTTPVVKNTLGATSGDKVVKIGSTVADASVNSLAKLVSVNTGLNGVETESGYVLKDGTYVTATGVGVGQYVSNRTTQGGFFFSTGDGRMGIFNAGGTLFFGMNMGSGASSSPGTFTAAALISTGTVTLKPATATGSPVTVGGHMNLQFTPVGNVGAGEDVLMTYSLPANTMVAASRGAYHEGVGTIANNANAKTLKVYFGAQMVSVTMPTSIAADWFVDAKIIRTAADAQRYVVRVEVINQATRASTVYVSQGTLAEVESGAIVVRITGEGVADNDLIQNMAETGYI